MGHNGCDGSQASGPWAIGSGYDFSGALFPCAVSRVLWCCIAVWCRAVARCCPFSFAGGVGLGPSLVFAVPCCAARRVVRCWFGLHCRWCLVLWCVAVCFGASL